MNRLTSLNYRSLQIYGFIIFVLFHRLFDLDYCFHLTNNSRFISKKFILWLLFIWIHSHPVDSFDYTSFRMHIWDIFMISYTKRNKICPRQIKILLFFSIVRDEITCYSYTVNMQEKFILRSYKRRDIYHICPFFYFYSIDYYKYQHQTRASEKFYFDSNKRFLLFHHWFF